jgi:chromosome segregation ATPase
MQADALSPEKRNIFPHESDVSRLFKQASHLRNSVSGEVLEQNFREKLADLSRALVSEKEANISLERRYCDEVEYRASLEGKLLEYERLLRSAEESLLLEKSQSEMREAELLSNLEKEKGYRQASEQQVISTKVEFSELNKAHQESLRRIQDLTNEVTRCTTEISLSKKETEEHKRGADQRQQRLIEDLRQTEDQRSHLDKLYQSSVAKVADMEALLEKTRSDLTSQIKILSDKLEREFADRTEAEETHVREIRALNDRIRSLGDSLQAEQEVLSKTKDDLLSASQARDRLQTRLNHLTDESMEMRKEMSAKRAEYENKLGLENDARERVEAQLADKCAQYEQVFIQFIKSQHSSFLMALESVRFLLYSEIAH